MKPYRILKDFPGNQTGNGPTEYFTAGTVAKLSDHLAEVAVMHGFAEPAEPETPENRQTKVDGPEETKAGDITKMNKKQLVDFAKQRFGIDLEEAKKKDELLADIDALMKAA